MQDQSYEEFLKEELARDPRLRKMLLLESIRCLLHGDVSTGKSVLGTYVQAADGFEKLAQLVDKSPKSLEHMLSHESNPRAAELLRVLDALRKREGLEIEVTGASAKPAGPKRRRAASARPTLAHPPT